MKGIVALRRADGTYDQVGMNNRIITPDYKTTKGIRDRAFAYAVGRRSKAVKIEFYPSSHIFRMPSSVEEWELTGTTWKQSERLVRK